MTATTAADAIPAITSTAVRAAQLRCSDSVTGDITKVDDQTTFCISECRWGVKESNIPAGNDDGEDVGSGAREKKYGYCIIDKL